MASTGVAAATPEDTLQRVVYHIDYAEPVRQRAALRTVANFLNDVGDAQADVRVIAQGNGVSMLLLPGGDASPMQATGNAGDRMQVAIEDLRLRGVRFQVCRSSLQRRGITGLERLYAVEPNEVIDSGMAELVRLQGQGYTYIKP